MKNVSYKYLELAHQKTGLSFYAIGKKIGISPTRINQAKNGKAELNYWNLKTPGLSHKIRA